DYVPRPPNAWMLFRSYSSKILAVDPDGKKRRQLELNSIISQQWHALPRDERAKWNSLAAEKKLEHKMRYPNYKYRPRVSAT
ncbi:high mobility group box domain-containing protein, partial [Mycena pura]